MPTLGEQQLAAWQDIAKDWPVSHDTHHDNALGRDRVYRCADCRKGVALVFDERGYRYVYTDEQWLALVVLHLRNHHADLDPDREAT